jgi:hypothetical protein
MPRITTAARKRKRADPNFALRPGVTNPTLWYPDRPPEAEWARIRNRVLERDNYTCAGCGHRALKYMHVHHLKESESNATKNLTTVCVACHAVLHMGRNISYGAIAIWECPITQAEVVRRTRQGIAEGQSLARINKQFKLKRGAFPPKSLEWANELVRRMGRAARASLPEPLCAVFVRFKQWQLETAASNSTPHRTRARPSRLINPRAARAGERER